MITGLPGKPGVPQVIDANGSKMSVEWRSPSDDGGCDIEGYELEYRVEGTHSYKRASQNVISDTKYVVKNLMEEMVYEFRVAAVNKAGTGPFSTGSAPIKASVPLGKRNLVLCYVMLYTYNIFY